VPETVSKPYPYILLITPPWVDEDARKRSIHAACVASPSTRTVIDGVSDRQNARTSQYAAACHRVAAQIRPQERILLLDLYERIQECPPQERMALLNDGLHLSARGQAFVFECIRELIAEKAPQLTPSSLGPYAIPWRNINPVRPREQLAIYE
jgi:lysophospholipase L1-like esterase